MRWWGWWRATNGAAHARANAEAKLSQAKKMTPLYERMAERMADLPDDEFAYRVSQAFRRRAT